MKQVHACSTQLLLLAQTKLCLCVLFRVSSVYPLCIDDENCLLFRFKCVSWKFSHKSNNLQTKCLAFIHFFFTLLASINVCSIHFFLLHFCIIVYFILAVFLLLLVVYFDFMVSLSTRFVTSHHVYFSFFMLRYFSFMRLILAHLYGRALRML